METHVSSISGEAISFTKRQFDNFFAKIKKMDCWEWTACVSQNGYGKVGLNSKTYYAHRVSYLFYIGDIPEGLELDHLCKNRKCVNPNHLELVTSKENTYRGDSPTAENVRKTHCNQGHPLIDSNLYKHKKWRICKICAKTHSLKYYYKNRGDNISPT